MKSIHRQRGVGIARHVVVDGGVGGAVVVAGVVPGPVPGPRIGIGVGGGIGFGASSYSRLRRFAMEWEYRWLPVSQ